MSMPEVPTPHWNDSPRDFNLRHDAAIIRGPIEWSWDVTNECAGACLHCFNRSNVLKRDELRDEEMVPVARQIAEFQSLGLCFCGGEPLLRLDLICELGAIIHSGGTTLNMVTNGMLVSESASKKLKNSWLQSVQVSLDGARAESHEKLRTIRGCFKKAVDAIKMLRSADITVGVAFTPTRFNVHEWLEVYDLCKSLGVFELRVQPLMPLGECNLFYDEIAPSEEQYSNLVMEYKQITKTPDPKIKVEWGDPVDHLVRFGQFYMMVPHSMHISSDGFVIPSPYLPVYLGNVRRHRLDEYWKAGLNTAWQIPLIREMAYRVRSIRDMRSIRPHPYFDAHIDYDLIDKSQEEKKFITNVVLNFIEKVNPEKGRPLDPWNWTPHSEGIKKFMISAFGNMVFGNSRQPSEEMADL